MAPIRIVVYMCLKVKGLFRPLKKIIYPWWMAEDPSEGQLSPDSLFFRLQRDDTPAVEV